MTASSSLNSDIHHENSKSQNDLNSQPSKILKNSSTNSDISKTTEVVTSNTDRPTASHDASDKWKASMNIKSDVEPSPLHLMNPQLMNNKQDTTAKKQVIDRHYHYRHRPNTQMTTNITTKTNPEGITIMIYISFFFTNTFQHRIHQQQ